MTIFWNCFSKGPFSQKRRRLRFRALSKKSHFETFCHKKSSQLVGTTQKWSNFGEIWRIFWHSSTKYGPKVVQNMTKIAKNSQKWPFLPFLIIRTTKNSKKARSSVLWDFWPPEGPKRGSLLGAGGPIWGLILRVWGPKSSICRAWSFLTKIGTTTSQKGQKWPFLTFLTQKCSFLDHSEPLFGRLSSKSVSNFTKIWPFLCSPNQLRTLFVAKSLKMRLFWQSSKPQSSSLFRKGALWKTVSKCGPFCL